jgi:hypothetical protein
MLRELRISSEIPDASRPLQVRAGMASLVWFAGEQVRILASLQSNRFPRALAATDTVVLEAWSGTDLATLFIDAPGTVLNATGGYLEIVLAPESGTLPPGAYNYQIKVFDESGDLVGVGVAGTLQVLSSPNSANTDYVGTSPALDLTNYSKPNCNFRFSGGMLQIYNPVTQLWYPLGIYGEAGAEQIIHGAGVPT